MCLGIPGKIINLLDEGPLTRKGKVSFGGILKEINLAYTPEASIGDYVIVHAGFAISKIDEQEANRVFHYLEQMEETGEIRNEEK